MRATSRMRKARSVSDDDLFGLAEDAPRHPMKDPCRYCGCTFGWIARKGVQDCVYCIQCGGYCYNASRAETGNPVAHVNSRHNISSSQRGRILNRDNCRCVFCGASGESVELQIGHLISVQESAELGVMDRDLQSDENLAACCPDCNLGLGKSSVSARLLAALIRRRQTPR